MKCVNPKCKNTGALDTFCSRCVKDLSIWTRMRIYIEEIYFAAGWYKKKRYLKERGYK